MRIVSKRKLFSLACFRIHYNIFINTVKDKKIIEKIIVYHIQHAISVSRSKISERTSGEYLNIVVKIFLYNRMH